ncbi:CLUMA_CG004275, isoform A [Clunio marinus]|uniref:CLUMA_CG004275, isoform A n=1 Tax=Clunio marinus TaxID=568069 RepID=A0A1J1HRC4_9DIPT|nr:CLUMA_CG004275, isoform A [Clunio marinus]
MITVRSELLLMSALRVSLKTVGRAFVNVVKYLSVKISSENLIILPKSILKIEMMEPLFEYTDRSFIAFEGVHLWSAND